MFLIISSLKPFITDIILISAATPKDIPNKDIIDIKEIKLSFLLVKRYLLAIKYSVFVKSNNYLLFFD